MQDSNVSDYSFVNDKLQLVFTQSCGKVVVDAAFCAMGQEGFLVKSGGDNEDATSIRQSAEWGMGQFQASFPRIKDHIWYEENGEGHIMLQTLVHLFNFRTNCIGCNQIRSVFLPF